MALSPEMEWTLVVSGLIAHADGVLESEECDRLMSLAEDDMEPDDYAEWMSLFGNVEALRQRFEQLPLPSADSRQELLERAWTMSMADGSSCEAEQAVLLEIGQRLGLDPNELAHWFESRTAASP